METGGDVSDNDPDDEEEQEEKPQFEWDPAKAKRNLKKHNEEKFYNEPE
jgi:hypothetical protein